MTLHLEGHSVAGVETAIEVPSLKLMLDMGRCTRSAVNHGLVLVSHGHLDHIGALTQHAARRAMMKMSVPIYLVPTAIAETAERLFNTAGELDGNPIPRKIVPMEPGQVFPLSANRYVRPFATFHRVPSQGYTIWERRTRLREDLRQTPGPELARLRAAGVAISVPLDVALLAFTGDTRVEVLESVDDVRMAETLILETSFLDARVSVSEARAMGHIHLDEVIDRAHLLSAPDLVFSHFSARYQADEVARILNTKLPEVLRSRTRMLR